jgi:hypothetical protein
MIMLARTQQAKGIVFLLLFYWKLNFLKTYEFQNFLKKPVLY